MKKGGKRKNSGRKLKTKTVVLSYRVPELLSTELDSKIKKLIYATNYPGQEQKTAG